MKYSSVITLCLISFILSSKPLGSWEPDTFARDDLYLDRSRSLAEKEYLKVTNANEDFTLFYPLSVYKQIVNGINFRIFLAAQNIKTNDIDLFDCIVNTPFQKANQDFTVYSSKILKMSGNVSINNSQYNSVNTVVGNYIKQIGEKMKFITSMVIYKNVIYDLNMFIVKVRTAESMKILILAENEDKKIEVAASLRLIQ